MSGFTKITGMAGAFVICSDAILGKFAKQLDTTLDDGETSTGSLRAVLAATATGAGVTTALITDSSSYSVCLAF
jgi:hypothetical protein